MPACGKGGMVANLSLGGISMRYYEINEETARRSRTGETTAKYRAAVDKAAALVERQKQLIDPFYYERLEALLDSYARRLALWINDYNRHRVDCYSGLNRKLPGSYDRDNRYTREYNMWKNYGQIQSLLHEIKNTGITDGCAD